MPIRYIRKLEWLRCDGCSQYQATYEFLDEGFLRVASACDQCVDTIVARYVTHEFDVRIAPEEKDPAWNTTSTTAP